MKRVFAVFAISTLLMASVMPLPVAYAEEHEGTDGETTEEIATCDSFTADPTEITTGGTSTLAWETTNATNVSIDNGVGEVDENGNTEVTVTEDTIYTLTAENSSSTDTCDDVTITVVEDTEENSEEDEEGDDSQDSEEGSEGSEEMTTAPFCELSADPMNFSSEGGTTTLAWETASATSISIDQNIGEVNESGTEDVFVSDSTTFTLTAANDVGSTTCDLPVEVATSTDDGGDGEPTEDGEGGGSGDNEEDGTDGGSGDDGTSENDGDDTTGDGSEGEGDDGTGGTEGGGGNDGNTAEASPEDEGEPVEVISEHNIGDDDAPEDEEEITGGKRGRGIETGDASAQGKVHTDVNSNNVRSEIEDETRSDFDTYTFNATGTNEATVDTTGATLANTGDNIATSRGLARIETGNAVSAFNVANIVNTNVVNSNGFLYLKNTELEKNQSLDLRGFFFPDEDEVFANAANCSLLSCSAEDVVYNFSQMNHATVTNDATVEAVTGKNTADGAIAQINTGDAYGGANVINVVNSNIIDSNYRIMTYNAFGDLDGDIMMPREELFHAFFSSPNGVSQTVADEGVDDVDISVENENEADVNNNLDTYAETGLNESTTHATDSIIKTGRGESESNVLNEINENIYGGDSMYMLVRIHGEWDGEVHGLPDGLAADPTPYGVVIYNKDAEIAPSEILDFDADTYKANYKNQNRVAIDNNINIDAITGENETSGDYGEIVTGEAYASANVINIANTNITGTNWSMAVVNIFGDFDGNIAFTETDLSLEGGMHTDDDPLVPGSELTYTYTVTNNGDIDATNVTLTQTLDAAYATGTDNEQIISFGDLAPGESETVALEAHVDPELAHGTHTVTAVARVESDESDRNNSDNVVHLSAAAENENAGSDNEDPDNTDDSDDNGTSTDDGTDSDDDAGDDDNDDSDNNSGENGENNDNDGGDTGSGGSGGSGGGGGGSSGGGGGSVQGASDSNDDVDSETSDLDVERTQTEVDPNDPPHILVSKESDTSDNEPVVAGEDVEYSITITNQGGMAYDAMLYDTLKNPIGSVVNEQSWEIGTILPGEQIKLSYTTTYSERTPSGTYTNTASVEAYRYEDDKEAGRSPLRLEDAVHTIEIDGVDLAVGNIEVLAYFPNGDDSTGALITWETSKPALSRVFYGPKRATSPYDPNSTNLGYDRKSFQFSDPKTKHFMIISGLSEGTTYGYRIHAQNGEYTATTGEHNFSVPLRVTSLVLPFLGGVTASVPSEPSNSTPTTPAPATTGNSEPLAARSSNTEPRSSPNPTPPQPEPEPESEPEPDPEPEPQEQEENNDEGGFVQKAKDTLFGFFR